MTLLALREREKFYFDTFTAYGADEKLKEEMESWDLEALDSLFEGEAVKGDLETLWDELWRF